MANDLSQVTASIIRKLHVASQLDALHRDLLALQEMVEADEIDLILEQPQKSDHQKKQFLQHIIKELHAPELKEGLAATLTWGSLDHFGTRKLKPFLNELQRALEDVATVKISVAVNFHADDINAMVSLLRERTGKPTVLELQVDPSLIAGAIVRYGNQLLDYSVRSQLQQLKDEWLQAVQSAAAPKPKRRRLLRRRGDHGEK